MKVLALDISTYTGYAVLERHENTYGLWSYGTIFNDQSVLEFGQYPYCYLSAAEAIAFKLRDVVFRLQPDAIVIEETNKAKARYTQKILEFIHCCLLKELSKTPYRDRVHYINTSDWRQSLDVYLSKEDKKNNSKLSKAKSKAKKEGVKLDKKSLGIRGRVNKKHVAIRTANEMFGLSLIKKDEDVADAICLGAAYINGVKLCDGK